MSIPIRNNIDLNQNQLLNALLQVLAAAPGSPLEGQLWYSSTSGKIEYRDATAARAVQRADVRLDQIVAPTAAIAMNGQKLTGLADGTSPTDAVTRQQLDSVAAGLDPHGSVRVASTANLAAISGAATLDGVAIATNDRVLLKNQTNKAENGVWVANTAGAWTRATDADAASDLSGGSFVFVEEGATQADTGWVVTTNGAITPGTTQHDWGQFTGPGNTLGGAGLTQTGNVLDVNVDSATIEIATDMLRVKDAGISTAKIADGAATLGPAGAGQKVTGTLPIANGGTGATTAPAARAALSAVGKFSADITGNGVATSFAVTHNLGTTDVQVQAWEVTTNSWTIVEIVRTDANTATLNFSVAPANGKTYRVVCMG